MRIFPDSSLIEINNALDPRRVLEFIGYKAEKIQDAGDTLRAFCPIHRENVFRTLVVNKDHQTFRCMYGLCDGAEGGSLVRLVALARRINENEAAEALMTEFGISIRIPQDPELLKKNVEVAENYLDLGYLDDAAKTFEAIVDAEPAFERAWSGLLKTATARQDEETQTRCRQALVRMALQNRQMDSALDQARALAASRPTDTACRKLVAECFLQMHDKESALEEFMAAADLCEAAGDWPGAIEAYTRIEDLDVDIVDVNPHLIHAFTQAGRLDDCVDHITGKASRAANHADFTTAAGELEPLFDVLPDRADIRSKWIEYALLASPREDYLPRVLAATDFLATMGEKDRAIEALRRLLTHWPRLPEAVDRLHAAYVEAGRTGEAADLKVDLARTLVDQGDLSAAREMLNAVLEMYPSHAAALLAAADVREGQGETGEANELLLRLAAVHLSQGDFAGASQVLERAATTEPTNPQIGMRRAEALEGLGRSGNVAALEAASRAWESVGDLFHDATSGHTATSHYLRASSLGPMRPELMSKLARSRFRSGDMRLARVAALEALEALEKAGRGEEALAEGEYFSQLLPADLSVAQRLAGMLKRAGRDDDALAVYRDTANAAIEKGDFETAERSLTEALALAPDSLKVLGDLAALQEGHGSTADLAKTLHLMAKAHSAAGDPASAVAALERVATLSPDDTEALGQLVAMYTEQGDAEAAHLWRAELAKVWRDRGDRNEERRVLAEGLAAFPDDEDFLALMIECQFAREHAGEACTAARDLAGLKLKNKKLDEARDVLRSASDKAPEDLPTAELLFELSMRKPPSDDLLDRARRLAELQVNTGRAGEAAATFAQVGDLFADDLGWKYEELELLRRVELGNEALEKALVLARLQTQAGATGEAERLLFEALGHAPGEARLHRRLAELFRDTGDETREREQWRALAETLHSAGDTDEALAVVRQVVEKHPRDVEVRLMVVDYLRARNDIADAATELTIIADLLREAGDAEGGLLSNRQAADLMPDDVPLRLREVTALRGLGRDEEAADVSEALATRLIETNRLKEAMAQLNALLEVAPKRLSAMKIRAELFAKLGDEERSRSELRIVAAATRLRQALQHREAGEHDRETQVLRDALTFSAEDPEILYELITCEFLRGDESAACAAARQLAAVQVKTDRAEDARATLASVLDRKPNDVETLRDLFKLLHEGGHTEEAVTRGLFLVELLLEEGREGDAVLVYDQIADADPTNLRLRMNRIDFLRRLGRTEEALERQFELAKDYHAREEYDEAEITYLQVLSTGPSHVGAREELVRLYEYLGNEEKAHDQLRQLAGVLHEAGEHARAIEAVKRVITANPAMVEARLQLVKFYRDTGMTTEAMDELHLIADVRREAGNEEGALEAEREATQVSPRHTPARVRYADALVAANQITIAIPELEHLAELQVEMNDHEAALETLERVLQISPDRPSTLIKRAEIYASLGEQEKALDAYRRVAMQTAQSATPAGGVPLAGAVTPRDGFLQLVKEYDFEHFVVGTHNNFAYATARAVANAPARAYNPLFLYSDVGLGKTHLVNAIANHVLREDPRARIIYTNSEDFTDELVNAIQTNAVNAFRAKYKNIDMLVVDDVQFLSGKERAQEEFFHIFNALFQSKRQIVVTSDRPPKDIAHLENRLLSRFGAGVIVDIAAPDYETRVAILNREIETNELGFNTEIAMMIAERVDSNVRELKGALNQVVAMRAIMGVEVTEDAVRKMLENRYAKVS